MIGRHLSAFALLLSCASAPLHAQSYSAYDADCWDRTEVEALKLQRFKTMLLVAMLNCRDQEPGIGEDYNRFVRANRDLIAAKQSLVRGHFIRTHGPSAGMNAWSAYETQLGNQFSNDDFTPERCADAAAEARLAGYVSERGLIDMLQSVPEEDLPVCTRQMRYAPRSAEWAPAPPPLAAPRVVEAAPPPPPPPVAAPAAPVEVAQNEWPDLAPVEPEGPARAVDPNEVRMAEAPPPPAPMPEKAAEPVQVAVIEEPRPAPAAAAEPVQVAAVDMAKAAPAPDRVKAVREAAKALREALAALEAEEGTNVR